ncbi:MAG: hypothetical protein COX80_02460 [Candidatus Magasanikbacteria bacterium CG_4_10_14_0_2_um_filter_33_14]|uniref:Four helix bundle protein n=1 Tax=Candidatus Magasanikbacteria bacterium CG_4_10_14_0_2_um_filter_33_14 TaxID=1974636 RepID=A0A2M7VAR0_9BACT|nr:MAG: hypothetical protein COX80_02460 [Candidatus Magasanikbacteria bacterium CG_4_10_14_0_2_um_filter_33_14]
MEFGYEKLDIAKLSRKLIKEIYKITEEFPKTELYGLTNQIRKASVSVFLNIAEGSSRETKKDFNKFVRISVGSLVEVDCALKIAIDLNFVRNNLYENLEPTIKELYFKLIGLSKYLKNS